MVGLGLPPVDAQAADRSDPNSTCYGCHFNPKNPYALDLLAQALPRKRLINGETRPGEYEDLRFDNREDAPEVLLQQNVQGLHQIVDILLSEPFAPDCNFNTCRMVFNFVFNRDDEKRERDNQFWQRTANDQELQVCRETVSLAANLSENPAEFWTYTCSMLIASAQFFSYPI